MLAAERRAEMGISRAIGTKRRHLIQSFLAEVGLPFGDLAYYKLNYVNQSFWPLYRDLVLMLKADIGYGDGYNDKPFPFFKAFYAGGVGSVRGYDAGTLGPRDIYGNTLGGKRKIVGNAEIGYPVIKGDKLFLDFGRTILRPGKDLEKEATERKLPPVPGRAPAEESVPEDEILNRSLKPDEAD